MTKFDFGASRNEAEKKHDIGGGDRFKFHEGDNRVRILSGGEAVATHRISAQEYHTCYGKDKGCQFHGDGAPMDKDGKPVSPSVKFAMWILDRKDGKVKLAFMPYKIYKGIGDLQSNPDYSFAEVPMPYDITVKATNAGKKEVEYTIMPSPKHVALTEDELDMLEKCKPIEDVVESMKQKAAKAQGHGDIQLDEETDETEDDAKGPF